MQLKTQKLSFIFLLTVVRIERYNVDDLSIDAVFHRFWWMLNRRNEAAISQEWWFQRAELEFAA